MLFSFKSWTWERFDISWALAPVFNSSYWFGWLSAGVSRMSYSIVSEIKTCSVLSLTGHAQAAFSACDYSKTHIWCCSVCYACLKASDSSCRSPPKNVWLASGLWLTNRTYCKRDRTGMTVSIKNEIFPKAWLEGDHNQAVGYYPSFCKRCSDCEQLYSYFDWIILHIFPLLTFLFFCVASLILNCLNC